MGRVQLKLDQIRYARQLARDCWVEAQGDIEQARYLFDKRAKDHGIDPMTIIALISLAIQLWKLWRDRDNAKPGDRDVNSEAIYGRLADGLTDRLEVGGRENVTAMGAFDLALRELKSLLRNFAAQLNRDDVIQGASDLYDRVIAPIDIPYIPNRVIEPAVDEQLKALFAKAAGELYDRIKAELS